MNDIDKRSNTSPFIIWTIQRTGATNLAHHLFDLFFFLNSSVEIRKESIDSWHLHEPFNISDTDARIYGHITQAWNSSLDTDGLEKSMDEICSKKLPIKHCVEMVPWNISSALAKASVKYGYRHLFLFRENALDRLLSLHFAQMTGFWGNSCSSKAQIHNEIFSTPLPHQELLKHENFCRVHLEKAWELLVSLNVSPFSVSFEEIYNLADFGGFKDRLLWITYMLDLNVGLTQVHKIAKVITQFGGQKTKQLYSEFTGISELSNGLNLLPNLSFKIKEYNLAISSMFDDCLEVIFGKIDISPNKISLGHFFDISGVILCKNHMSTDALKINLGKDTWKIRWGIKSPAMFKRFPDITNSYNSRFKVRGLFLNESDVIDIFLEHQNNKILLFRLTCIIG